MRGVSEEGLKTALFPAIKTPALIPAARANKFCGLSHLMTAFLITNVPPGLKSLKGCINGRIKFSCSSFLKLSNQQFAVYGTSVCEFFGSSHFSARNKEWIGIMEIPIENIAFWIMRIHLLNSFIYLQSLSLQGFFRNNSFMAYQ